MTSIEPKTPLLAVKNLRIMTSEGRTLVRGVSLELGAGETLGIVGESGSGKTLTARAISSALAEGLEARGEVVFDNVSLLGRSESFLRPLRANRFAMVLQDPFTSLNPLQTVREHLYESLDPSVRRDRAFAKTEVVRRLAEVGLGPEVAGRYPFQLSGGMRQRVAIAAALARDPELLVADEPTTALDATTQAQVLDLLRKLQKDRGMALVLITHDLRVAFSMCDRVMVMYAGTVLENAPAKSLSTDPKHPYSLGLMVAEPPVAHYQDSLDFVPGSVPRAEAVQDTCAFADRCRWRRDECVASAPPLAEIPGTGALGIHLSACLRAEQIQSEMRAVRSATRTPGQPPALAAGRPLLRVADVSKRYRTHSLLGRSKDNIAVHQASFEIAEGESLGLLGETGSGKTTLARCILGLVTPSTGSISLDGADITDYRKLSREQRGRVRQLIQIVFQDPYASLNPSLSIGAALREAITAGDGSRDRPGTVDELLDLVGLPRSYAGRLPSALSGGERQRIAIARALAVGPKLLICDEPVAALDVSVQAQILELLRDVRRRYSTSMLFITHDLSVVRQMTDRAIVLRRGEIVEAAPTAQLLDFPQHEYTKSLVASVPGMNLSQEQRAEPGHPSESQRLSFSAATPERNIIR